MASVSEERGRSTYSALAAYFMIGFEVECFLWSMPRKGGSNGTGMWAAEGVVWNLSKRCRHHTAQRSAQEPS